MMLLAAQLALGTLLCSAVPKGDYPADTCVLSFETPLPEGNWLTFFSGSRVLVAGSYPAGTKTLSIGQTAERIYLVQFYGGEQIQAAWEEAPEVTIQPVGEPLVLRILKAPLRLVKGLVAANK